MKLRISMKELTSSIHSTPSMRRNQYRQDDHLSRNIASLSLLMIQRIARSTSKVLRIKTVPIEIHPQTMKRLHIYSHTELPTNFKILFYPNCISIITVHQSYEVIPYSRKYWWELNLAVEPKIAIARILADLNLAVRYRIAIRIHASRKLWQILI